MAPRWNVRRRAAVPPTVAALVAGCGGRQFPGGTGPEATPPAESPAQSPDVDLEDPGPDPDAAEDVRTGTAEDPPDDAGE